MAIPCATGISGFEDWSSARPSEHDVNIYVRRLELSEEAQPQGEVHLLGARGGDVAKVDDFLPPEAGFQEVADRRLRLGVVSGDEHRVDTRYQRWLDHQRRSHCIE